jgi:hypothetical protein
MKWAGNLARMGRRGMHAGYWWENVRGRDHWEYQNIDGQIKLKWISER